MGDACKHYPNQYVRLALFYKMIPDSRVGIYRMTQALKANWHR